MTSFEPQSEVAQGFYARIPVKMKIRGNYHSIAVFFDKIAKLARIVNVYGDEVEHVESPEDGLFVRTTTLSTVAAGERVATVALLE